MKKIWKHGSTALLLIIIAILLVPSWRVSFQGWFQSVFMGSTYFENQTAEKLPAEVENWEFEDVNGNFFQFSNFDNRPIVLSFWATWCPPCRAELPELKALQQEVGKAVHFIAVSEEPVAAVTKSGLYKKYDFLYANSHYPRFFKINAYPTLCIIDANRNLIYKHQGAGGLNSEKNIAFLKGLIENQ